MKVTYNKEQLIAFEDDIAECFANKLIRAPIHLYNGNEDQTIEIFNKWIDASDWLLCSWRSHYQCLLKGVPKEELKKDILDGKSISLCYPEYNILSSAIVGGHIPIATGIAMGLKRSGSTNKVVCFLGDMTSFSGTFIENMNYCINHKLPILYVIEDNGKSVCTDTYKTWMNSKSPPGPNPSLLDNLPIITYSYKSKWPHAGGNTRVQF